jgi:hypothetical protein
MKNAQKIIRRDPDLMTVMQININDSDITTQQTQPQQKKDKDKKEDSKINLSKSVMPPKTEAPKIPTLTKNPSEKKKGYGNLFG